MMIDVPLPLAKGCFIISNYKAPASHRECRWEYNKGKQI
jgi:hypothetical protein